ncbi:hypothetical protein BDB00DRAFT_816878 [Zychaea mexicana]|uniref:uncharacterized protein n=1 Tax=Zychaea mexicana TaxID=64656 RepID=UPI0022FE682D|nr:uncharacterized protein BDB00DRAFT_816878 [Zychaea mexicana]KAI9494741.1 hypothetical protein BDB00DRAFT_816878 [Zychaea mexicana]
MNSEETFKKGVEYREAGNEAFKKGDYPAALSNYYHALLHLRTVGGLQPANDLKERSNEQLVKIYNNQCAVLAKQEKWPRVLDTATKAREIDAENLKSKFRQGQAYARMGDVDKAKEVLNEVLQKDPKDAAVKQELALIKQQDKKGQEQVKKAYWGMFDQQKKA